MTNYHSIKAIIFVIFLTLFVVFTSLSVFTIREYKNCKALTKIQVTTVKKFAVKLAIFYP